MSEDELKVRKLALEIRKLELDAQKTNLDLVVQSRSEWSKPVALLSAITLILSLSGVVIQGLNLNFAKREALLEKTKAEIDIQKLNREIADQNAAIATSTVRLAILKKQVAESDQLIEKRRLELAEARETPESSRRFLDELSERSKNARATEEAFNMTGGKNAQPIEKVWEMLLRERGHPQGKSP